MAKRGTKRPSDVFRTVLADARSEVLLGGSRAGAFQHRGVRGDERAGALAKFLRERLPSRFAVGKGEVIDYRDYRTGQLDIIVYDSATCAPISVQSENVLVPCEALYVVVEVKSTLTGAELQKSYAAAGRVRQLRPFKSRFIGPRREGGAADDGAHRCQYLLVAYSSDLANNSEWLQKEFSRVAACSASVEVALDSIDRVVVLDRGMLNPGGAVGESSDPETSFLDSYLHLVNFVSRESGRRPPVDWQMYGAKTSRSWKKLKAV